ncbi:MAG: hypothetical protein HY864_12065 [Chloroflexi bacterium]|nr:hypothetical protein [Chloroflexota bacterium]
MDLFMNVTLIYLVLMVIGTGFVCDNNSSEPASFRKLYFCNQQKIQHSPPFIIGGVVLAKNTAHY